MTTKKDSRRDPRAKVLSMTVRYKSATVAEFIENHSYDVSRGGMFIKTTSPFPAGTLLKFEVRIAEEQKVMMGVGRVTWRRETERGTDKPAGMGVKFIKIGGESVELIQRVVEARHDEASSFEEGAADEGIRLSAPPEELRRRELASTVPDDSSDRPTPFFPADGSNKDSEVPDPSMLMQSSELLRSALKATETGRSTRDSDGPEISAISEPPETSSQPPDAVDSDRQTLPTGESDAEEDVDGTNAGASSEEDESTDDLNDADEDDGSDDATGSSRRDSKQPKSKRGKKKNPKKKKKKFKYSNIPTGKELDAQPGVAASEMLTTPPTRAIKPGTQAPEADNTPFKILLVALALAVATGLYLLNNKTPVEPAPEPASRPAEAPPVVAEAPPKPAPKEEMRPADVMPDAAPAPTGTVAPAPSAEPAGAAAPPAKARPAAPKPPAPKPPAPKPVAPKPAQPQKPATPPPSKPVAPKPTDLKAPVTPSVPPKTPSAPTGQPSPPAVVAPKPAAPQAATPVPAPESPPKTD